MSSFDEAAAALENPGVKSFLLNVLRSQRPIEEKYATFVSWFRVLAKLDRQVALQLAGRDQKVMTAPQLLKVLASAAHAIGIWQPQKILDETANAVDAGVRWILRSQHPQEGYWGYGWQQSDVWGTAHALLALGVASGVASQWTDVPAATEAGARWLIEHDAHWRPYWLPSEIGGREYCKVYEASAAIRALGALGRRDAWLIECVRALAAAQNRDGGWDANILAPGRRSPSDSWSEVGATSMAIQAMSAVFVEELRPSVQRGAHWLIGQQNDDGSWNNGACAPGQPRVDGRPSVTKSCDAVTGISQCILVGLPDTDLSPASAAVNRAIDWILCQERLSEGGDHGAPGWVFADDPEVANPANLDSTCLTMETLLAVREISTSFLTANARRLVAAQLRRLGAIEDGMWTYGDTFRITRGLLTYYGQIKMDPIFHPDTLVVTNG